MFYSSLFSSPSYRPLSSSSQLASPTRDPAAETLLEPTDSIDMGKSPESPDGHDVSPPSDGFKQPLSEVEELQGHTLYEKKCIVVNRAIDGMGMGRYQWYIWGLCGSVESNPPAGHSSLIERLTMKQVWLLDRPHVGAGFWLGLGSSAARIRLHRSVAHTHTMHDDY